MNKKYLMFAVLGLFAIGLVSAIAYYTVFSQSFTVVSAISATECSDTFGDVFSGDVIIGKECTIINRADTERTISITEDSDDNVTVSYTSDLGLTKKVVDFNSDIWNVTEGKVNVTYTLVGNEFTAEVSEPITDYVLVYYKDNDERFNNPATAIGIDEIVGNLPNEDDMNLITDYSEEYSTTPHGAKIWYIPTGAVSTEGVVDWSQASSFYFESKLIQYNSDGIITLYGESEITITPIYTVGDYATGEYTITTTIA